LTTHSPNALTELPDVGLLTVALGLACGVLQEQDGDVRAAPLQPHWQQRLPALLTDLWSCLPLISGWNPVRGWQINNSPGNPYPGAHLLALMLLAQLKPADWAYPEDVAAWVIARHPFWSAGAASRQEPEVQGLTRLLLGVAHPLRLLQATRAGDGRIAVRLSPQGRWMLGFGAEPMPPPDFPQTLLVQPNLEILVYRQGLNPELIVQLTRFAAWKTLGAACTLQLEPAGVYSALEGGMTFEAIMQTLERRGMKPVPTAVLEALRTWSNKRERITIWSSAALFEFPTPDELTDALARGLPAVRLTDRLAVVADEDQIDYRHFRLTGTRDYCLPPERCVEIDGDGVVLSVDLARSDLLLESEVQRFAEPRPGPTPPGRKLYQLTIASVAQAKQSGLTLAALEMWFHQRTNSMLSPAARLLFGAADAAPGELRRQLVLHVADIELADGILQWPATRGLIQARLGPTALAVHEADKASLEERLRELGMGLVHGEGTAGIRQA
jgi:hypothetical protein